jgi:putative inorganic carbon (HCO3(-)) transporter
MPSQTLVRTRPSPPPARLPAPQAAERPVAGSGLGFFLFLLVNAALWVRPADVVPALLGLEIYQYLILACLAVSFPAVLASLAPDKLSQRPITVCMLLLLPAISFSLITRTDELGEASFAVFKILVYYLLLTSLVTTPQRLRIFTACLILFAVPVVILSALDLYEVIKIPRLVSPGSKFVHEKGRMYGPGIFQDPNDTCVLIGMVMLLVIGKLADKRAGFLRWLIWLPCVAVFAFGFYLTGSRGGLLALMGGLGLMTVLRFGWRRAILIGMIGAPVLLVLLGGRQTDISADTDTGKLRVFLWSDGLVMFRSNPLTGVGWGHYNEHAGQVAHNSYMHLLSETGIVGGSLFLGAAFLSLWGLYRLSRPVRRGQQLVLSVIRDPDLRQIYPYLSGAVAVYAMGMMTLSLADVPPPYTMFGLACVFQAMTVTDPEHPPLSFDFTMPLKFVGLSLLFLVGMFCVVRFFMGGG